MLQRGQKVVCISAPWHSVPLLPWACPSLNSVYSIREIVLWPNGAGASVRLMEIRNEPISGSEPAFSAKYFRPITQTDISIFTAMLSPRRESVDA